jgi:hypothetical protein
MSFPPTISHNDVQCRDLISNQYLQVKKKRIPRINPEMVNANENLLLPKLIPSKCARFPKEWRKNDDVTKDDTDKARLERHSRRKDNHQMLKMSKNLICIRFSSTTAQSRRKITQADTAPKLSQMLSSATFLKHCFLKMFY